MEQSGLRFENLDAIGVTQGPGLVGSLLVGITYGKTLAATLGKPLIGVNHLEGHIHAAFLEAYDATAREAGLYPSLEAIRPLLSLFETERALYELRYELQNRPDWAAIPLDCLRTLRAAEDA